MTSPMMMAGAAPAAPDVISTTDTDSDSSVDVPYNTLIWNDPVNLTSQVTYVLQKVMGMDRVKAEAIMWEAHTNGKAVVFSGPRPDAEAKALVLLGWQINSTVEKA